MRTNHPRTRLRALAAGLALLIAFCVIAVATRGEHPAPAAGGVDPAGVDDIEVATRPGPVVRAENVRDDDRQPLAQISGALWENDGAVLREDLYPLEVDAVDGAKGTKEAGVEAIRIQVDGKPVYEKRNPCDKTGCGLQGRWSFETARFGDGDHRISVLVSDQSANTVENDVNVTVARREPRPPQTIPAEAVKGQRFSGASAGDEAGRTVESVGDVNGDLIDDYAIGAPGADPKGRTDAGSVYIVFGGQRDPLIGLDEPARPGFRIDGAAPGQFTGGGLASAGDVNKDTYDDLLVGAPGVGERATGGPVTGRVWVVFGGPANRDIDLGKRTHPGFEITGPVVPSVPAGQSPGAPELEPDVFGEDLAGPETGLFETSADVNGDGYDDVVIGSATESRSGRARSGSVYVIYGKRHSYPVNVSKPGKWGFRIDGAAGSLTGHGAVTPGDVNGDGFADVLVSAPGSSPQGRTAAGSAFLVLGKKRNADMDLETLGKGGFPILGGPGDRLGSSVSATGDLDGDDLDDFALAGHGGFVVYGDSSTDDQAVDLAGSYDGFAIEPPAGDGYATAVIEGGGDLNGDEIPDFLLGFPDSSPAAAKGGSLWAVFGREDPIPQIELEGLPGQWGTQIVGREPGERIGASTDGVDFDRNSAPGFLVGAPNESFGGPPGSGTAIFVPGQVLAGNFATASRVRQTPRQFVRRRGCYPFPTPSYGYRRQSDNPLCRATSKGKLERALSPKVGYGRAAQVLARPIKPGKHPVVDSFGTRFSYIEQTAQKQFSVYNYRGTYVGKTKRSAALQMQGRGCMVTDRLIEDYVILTLFSDKGKNQGVGPGGRVVDVGVRGFVKRNVLPRGIFRRTDPSGSSSNDRVIDKFDSGCGKPSLYESQKARPTTIGKAIFDPQSDRYQGAQRACDATSLSDCGGTYHDYSRPEFDAGVVPIVSASTGVRNGGIVRAITESDRPFRILDEIAYSDPNVPCGRRPAAQWIYGDANPFAGRGQNHIFGFVPRRVPGGTLRRC